MMESWKNLRLVIFDRAENKETVEPQSFPLPSLGLSLHFRKGFLTVRAVKLNPLFHDPSRWLSV
jgi:hypothetical protein